MTKTTILVELNNKYESDIIEIYYFLKEEEALKVFYSREAIQLHEVFDRVKIIKIYEQELPTVKNHVKSIIKWIQKKRNLLKFW